MKSSRRSLCINTARALYDGDLTTAMVSLESSMEACFSDPSATPLMNPLLDAIDQGKTELAADILYYYLSDEPVPDLSERKLHLLIYEWSAYMQNDLEHVLDRIGISYDRFSYVFFNRYHDDYLQELLLDRFEESHYDAVFSMNYWPALADICHIAGIPYVAWSYDCPLPFELEPSIFHDTNRLFVFDRSLHIDAIKKGYTTVDHIPLAVDCPRLESITLSDQEQSALDTDISFVGNLYSSDISFYLQFLTEDEKAYIEAIIQKQLRTYGVYFLNQVVTEDFIESVFTRIESAGNPIGLTRSRLKTLFERSLAREVTSRERSILLKNLSEHHTVRLYGPTTVANAPNLIHAGSIDNGNGMIKVFKASRINLNITYRQIPFGIPLRVFDILGAGGFLLTNYQHELSVYLTPGEDFIYYDSLEDALEKADYYLTHEEERKRIATHGHDSIRRFSYENQLAKILHRSL